MVEFLYTGTKARKLNVEIFVSFFPDEVELKSTTFVIHQKAKLKMT